MTGIARPVSAGALGRGGERTGQAPRIGACWVIGVPGRAWCERVHAVVVPGFGHAPTVEELHARQAAHRRLQGAALGGVRGHAAGVGS